MDRGLFGGHLSDFKIADISKALGQVWLDSVRVLAMGKNRQKLVVAEEVKARKRYSLDVEIILEKVKIKILRTLQLHSLPKVSKKKTIRDTHVVTLHSILLHYFPEMCFNFAN